MSNCLISIIIPAYQAARTIGRAVNSVRTQSYTCWECIIVDDGSTDETLRISNEYSAGDARIRVIHQSNSGRCAARNTGIDASRGDWIAFLDADDCLYPHSLERLSAELSAEVVGVCGACDLDNGSKIKISGPAEISADSIIESIVHPNENNGIAIGQDRTLLRTVWGKLYNRKRIDKYGVRFVPGLRFGEDALFNINYLALGGEVVVIDSSVYYYDTSASSTSGHFSKCDGEALLALAKAFDSLEGKGLLSAYSHGRSCVDEIIGTEAVNILKSAARADISIKEAADLLRHAFENPRIIASFDMRSSFGSSNRLLRFLRLTMLKHGCISAYLFIERQIVSLKNGKSIKVVRPNRKKA